MILTPETEWPHWPDPLYASPNDIGPFNSHTPLITHRQPKPQREQETTP